MLDALARRDAPAWLDRGFRLVTELGGATATVGLSLLLIAVPSTRRLGLIAGTANLLSHIGVQALKRLVLRERPSIRAPDLRPLATSPDEFSFPSGHACASMSLATLSNFGEDLVTRSSWVVTLLSDDCISAIVGT